MYQILNEKELLVAKNIVNIALANSAESFSKLAKKKFSTTLCRNSTEFTSKRLKPDYQL